MARKPKAQFAGDAARELAQDELFEQQQQFYMLKMVALAFVYNELSLKGGWGEAHIDFKQKEDADGVPFFTLTVTASSAYSREMTPFGISFDDRMKRQDFEFQMFEFKSEINYMQGYVDEQEDKLRKKSAALAKLTKEERDLLGV